MEAVESGGTLGRWRATLAVEEPRPEWGQQWRCSSASPAAEELGTGAEEPGGMATEEVPRSEASCRRVRGMSKGVGVMAAVA